MAVWALIIAILGVLIAIAAAYLTRKMAATDADRRHDERTPVFDVTFDFRRWAARQSGLVPVVAIRYVVGPDLDEVVVDLVNTSHGKPQALVGLSDSEQGERALSVLLEGAPIRPGDERILEAHRADDYPDGSTSFRLLCRSGKERWAVPAKCDTPGRPRMINLNDIDTSGGE